MDNSVMHKIKDDLCKSLAYYAEKGINSAEDIETVKHIISGLYKIKVMQAMDAYNHDDGYSNRMYHDDNNSYRRGADGRYMDSGSSYRGYSRNDGYHDGGNDGYSGHGNIREKLSRMMDNADGREREIIQKIMNQV